MAELAVFNVYLRGIDTVTQEKTSYAILMLVTRSFMKPTRQVNPGPRQSGSLQEFMLSRNTT